MYNVHVDDMLVYRERPQQEMAVTLHGDWDWDWNWNWDSVGMAVQEFPRCT
jgi:hypothetical protein